MGQRHDRSLRSRDVPPAGGRRHDRGRWPRRGSGGGRPARGTATPMRRHGALRMCRVRMRAEPTLGLSAGRREARAALQGAWARHALDCAAGVVSGSVLPEVGAAEQCGSRFVVPGRSSIRPRVPGHPGPTRRCHRAGCGESPDGHAARDVSAGARWSVVRPLYRSGPVQVSTTSCPTHAVRPLRRAFRRRTKVPIHHLPMVTVSPGMLAWRSRRGGDSPRREGGWLLKPVPTSVSDARSSRVCASWRTTRCGNQDWRTSCADLSPHSFLPRPSSPDSW